VAFPSVVPPTGWACERLQDTAVIIDIRNGPGYANAKTGVAQTSAGELGEVGEVGEVVGEEGAARGAAARMCGVASRAKFLRGYFSVAVNGMRAHVTYLPSRLHPPHHDPPHQILTNPHPGARSVFSHPKLTPSAFLIWQACPAPLRPVYTDRLPAIFDSMASPGQGGVKMQGGARGDRPEVLAPPAAAAGAR
jgi:hypothetical protein